MADERTLELQLLNVHGQPIGEQVDVMLRHQATGRVQVAQVKASQKAAISGLASDGVYRVEVDPPSYLATGAFVIVRPGTTSLTLMFPIDPQKVKDTKFPAYDALNADARRILEASKSVFSFTGQSGRALYDALDPLRRAGFLNIIAKMSSTTLTNRRLVSSYIVEVTELRAERFFTTISRELREETKNSAMAGLFVPAPDVLHRPPDGFNHAGSYKTPDRYGNLQLTFFTNGTDWVADIDIDNAAGLEHVFQVLDHQITNTDTHPYDIRDILIAYQKLDPGYDLLV